MILRGPTMHLVSDWPPDPERHAFDGDIRPIADYPKDQHQGQVLLFCPQGSWGWAIGSWDWVTNAWLRQGDQAVVIPTHFMPLPDDTIEIFDS